ncbi:response regulator [Shinella sp. M31]|uniref:response regulator n=1 Tax=Shinella sp. M31 TaxID=3368615 RepID=UPI003BA3DD5D
MSYDKKLSGKRILVAEDDILLALLLVDDLTTHGAEVLGPYATCADVLSVLERLEPFDLAVLDVNLLDGPIYPAAERLLDDARSFIFASSVVRGDLPTRFERIPLFSKPLDMQLVFVHLDDWMRQ